MLFKVLEFLRNSFRFLNSRLYFITCRRSKTELCFFEKILFAFFSSAHQKSPYTAYGKAYFMQIDVQSTQTDRSMSRFLANVYNCNVSTKDYILLDISFGAIIIAPPWRGERQNN